MSYLITYFITIKKKMTNHFPCPRGSATGLLARWAACIPTGSSGIRMDVGTVSTLSCQCLLDTHTDRQLLKSVTLQGLTENIQCGFTQAAECACLKSANKGCFLLLSSVPWEDLVAFPNMESQPVPDSAHSKGFLPIPQGYTESSSCPV